MDNEQQDTIRCSPVDPTTPAPSGVTVDPVVVPRDSEWAGFSSEMAKYLAEILEQDNT